jgi:nitric oxide reductase activation protein
MNTYRISVAGAFVATKTIFTFIFAFMLLIGRNSAHAQNPKFPPMPEPTAPPSGSEPKTKMERDMEKKANQDRQAALKRDTEKLLKLATELKDYVDKTNENVLSFDVVKKAEEIEKLAHSVKEKMKAN